MAESSTSLERNLTDSETSCYARYAKGLSCLSKLSSGFHLPSAEVQPRSIFRATGSRFQYCPMDRVQKSRQCCAGKLTGYYQHKAHPAAQQFRRQTYRHETFLRLAVACAVRGRLAAAQSLKDSAEHRAYSMSAAIAQQR